MITTALFDIDGTLLHGRPIAHGLAMVEGLNQAFDLALAEADLLSVDLAGKTDLHIANDLLDRAGVESSDREARLRRWCALAAGVFAAIADHHDDPVVAPDADATLAVLRADGLRTSLVTGNIEDIAHHLLKIICPLHGSIDLIHAFKEMKMGLTFCLHLLAFGDDALDAKVTGNSPL